MNPRKTRPLSKVTINLDPDLKEQMEAFGMERATPESLSTMIGRLLEAERHANAEFLRKHANAIEARRREIREEYAKRQAKRRQTASDRAQAIRRAEGALGNVGKGSR